MNYYFCSSDKIAIFNIGNCKFSISITDPLLARVLGKLAAKLLPGDFILGLTAPQYRIIFAAAVAAAGLPATFKPYSLRRGGATWHFRLHGNIGLTMEVGRWANMRTARTYVNTALMELTALTVLESPEIHQASDYFSAILAHYVE